MSVRIASPMPATTGFARPKSAECYELASTILTHDTGDEPRSPQTEQAWAAQRSHRISIPPSPSRLTSFIAPNNFGTVEPNLIYRCAYPVPENYDFIASFLRINTIITLVPEPLSEPYMEFMLNNHIRHFQIHVPANKDGVIKVTQECIDQVLRKVLNRNYYPLLVHCNRGKHRTGCVTACFRKMQQRSSAEAVAEYESYAQPKVRPDDVAFIESYDSSCLATLAKTHDWHRVLAPCPPDEQSIGVQETDGVD